MTNLIKHRSCVAGVRCYENSSISHPSCWVLLLVFFHALKIHSFLRLLRLPTLGFRNWQNRFLLIFHFYRSWLSWTKYFQTFWTKWIVTSPSYCWANGRGTSWNQLGLVYASSGHAFHSTRWLLAEYSIYWHFLLCKWLWTLEEELRIDSFLFDSCSSSAASYPRLRGRC